jgi:hypothetical protein
MKVTNKASFEVIAFGWHKLKGRGVDVRISPGETAEVNGPRIVETGDRIHEVSLTGSIICHAEPDDERGFELLPGKILSVGGMVRGVTIRHHLD